MIPSLILKAIHIEVGCMIIAAYIGGIKIWVGLMHWTFDLVTVSLMHWTFGLVTVSLICWTLWSCDCQSDVLDFVVM